MRRPPVHEEYSMASTDLPAPSNVSAVSPEPSSVEVMIHAVGLNKYFGDRHVLCDIDFSVKRGECVAIIGPSGSGKSTLIRCLNYLETPTSGSIIIDAKQLHGRLTPLELSLV